MDPNMTTHLLPELRPGDHVFALRVVDGVEEGTIGVVFFASAYETAMHNCNGQFEYGPLVAWLPVDGKGRGHICNVYAGDVRFFRPFPGTHFETRKCLVEVFKFMGYAAEQARALTDAIWADARLARR